MILPLASFTRVDQVASFERVGSASLRTIGATHARVLAFVAWLTGQQTADAALQPEHDELYLEFSRKHRVAGRVVERLLQSARAEKHPRLFQLLSEDFCRDIAQQQGTRAAALAFFRSLGPLDRDFIVVKGAALFHATGNPFRIRRSNDTDMLVPDPTRLQSLVGHAGIEEYKVPVLHEEVNLLYAGFKYDVHRHFPVWRQHGSSVDVTALPAQGHIRHQSNVSISRLGYEEIRAESRVDARAQGIRLHHPGATLAAFLQVVHFHRDLIRLFVGWTYTRTRISLQELLDIRELVADPDFDSVLFRSLVEHHGAREQARACASYLLAIVGDGALLDVLRETPAFTHLDEPAAFRAELWHGFSFEFRLSPAHLLLEPFAAPQAAAQLLPNALKRGATGHFALDDDSSRLHLHGQVSAFELTIRESETLDIELLFAAPTEGEARLAAFVSWGLHSLHFNFEDPDVRRRQSLTRGAEVLSCAHEQDGMAHRVALKLRVPTHPGGATGEPVAGILAAGLLHEGGGLEHGVLLAFSSASTGRRGPTPAPLEPTS
jgi:hypothetical protein